MMRFWGGKKKDKKHRLRKQSTPNQLAWRQAEADANKNNGQRRCAVWATNLLIILLVDCRGSLYA